MTIGSKLGLLGRRVGVGLAVCIAIAPIHAAAESIERAVVNAILNSDARKAARADILAQVNDLRETQSGFGPTISLYADARAEAIDNPSRFAPGINGHAFASREAGVTLKLPLFDGGQRAALVRRSAATVDGAIIRMIDETETLALNAVQAYIDLVRFQQIRALTRRNVERHLAIRRKVRLQIEGGRLPGSDGLRVDERVAIARTTQTDAEAAFADAQSRYRLHIGHTPDGRVSMPRRIKGPANREALVQQAIRNSARLLAIDKQTAELAHQNTADMAEYAPQVSAQAGAYAGADMDGTPGHETGAYLGLNLNWTLYKGGARKHREAANRDRMMRNQYRRADQARQIRDLSERAWNAHRKAVLERGQVTKQLQLASNLVAAYREEFDAGKRPLFDVLEAERTLFNYQVLDITTRANEHYNLYKMLAVQTRLADHFGMAHAGRAMAPDFEDRSKANPRAVFDISVPPLDK